MNLAEELKKIENDVLTRKQIEDFEKLKFAGDFTYEESFKNTNLTEEFLKKSDLTEEFKLYVVSLNGYNIQLIKNPSEQVQLVAVKQDGISVKFILDPSEEVQLTAFEKNEWACQYIENPINKIKRLARQQGFSI